MDHVWEASAANGVNIFSIDYQGEGRYLLEVTVPGIIEGDRLIRNMGLVRYFLRLDEILIQEDAKGKWDNPEQAKMAFIKGYFQDENYQPLNYKVLSYQ